MKTKFTSTSIICFFIITTLVVILPHSWAADPQLSKLMQRNFQIILELQKETALANRFSKQKNKSQVVALVEELRRNAHDIPQQLNQTSQGQAAIGVVFANYLEDLERLLNAGDLDYARNKIRTATGFCMECHTSIAGTPRFIEMEKGLMNSMSGFEQAEFFAATRQFDRAIAAYQKLFSEGAKKEENSRLIARAIRGALNISVRVLQDPVLTNQILAQALQIKDLPPFLVNQVKQWQADTKTWASDLSTAPKTAAQGLARADQLFKQVERKQQYPSDHSMDISLLRAVSYVHEALTKNPTAAEKSKAFYLLGSANTVLADPLLWALDEVYYESCVREMPHSAIARQCFDRFAQKLYFEYSGSSGIELPPEDLTRLTQLRELAQ